MSGIFAAGSLAEYLKDPVEGWGWSESTAYVVAAIVHVVLLINVFALAPFFFIWLERKASGRIQDRLGPTRVGGKFGWLQSLADGVKLIQKEDLCPPAADSMLFRVAPYLVCISSFAAFVFLPFSEGWTAVAADVGLFLIVAILSLEVFGIILAGYASASKWSLFGGMREAAQMVSYEIPLAICALVPIVTIGSLNLSDIGRAQSGWIIDWMIFHDPFTFCTFFVYFTVATASCKRAPFDLAEAESELVGGFHTEYSGMRWSFFFMGEYASMFLVCALAAILFLGAWHTGLPVVDDMLQTARDAGGASGYLANLLGMAITIFKGGLLVFVQIWLRWTLPRLRIDQVMMTCLKYLIPISCFLFLGVIVWPMLWLTVSDAPISHEGNTVRIGTTRTTWLPSALGDRMPAGPAAAAPAGAWSNSDNDGSNDSSDAETGEPQPAAPAEAPEDPAVGNTAADDPKSGFASRRPRRRQGGQR